MSAAQPESPLKPVTGKRTDVRALAAKVFERHGIGLREDDPAFALVTLNELVLRNVMDESLKNLDQHITARLAEFEQTMLRVEQRASKVWGQQMRESIDVLRGQIQEETATARLGLHQMVEQFRSAYRVGTLARWYGLCGLLAAVVFAFGFWVGRL